MTYVRREYTIQKMVASGMTREMAEYHYDHNTVYPEIVEALMPEERPGITHEEAERLKPRRFNFSRGRWAIVRIGRLSFHATRYGFTIGWVNDDYDYYHPSLRMEW
jgi:hypothetical protein